jgi:hypothetical protein
VRKSTARVKPPENAWSRRSGMGVGAVGEGLIVPFELMALASGSPRFVVAVAVARLYVPGRFRQRTTVRLRRERRVTVDRSTAMDHVPEGVD